jgi:hypothetical protein
LEGNEQNEEGFVIMIVLNRCMGGSPAAQMEDNVCHLRLG